MTGKVAGAKNPRKWGNFFEFRAAYAEPPHTGAKVSAVRLTLPDGTTVTSDQPDLTPLLSKALGRERNARRSTRRRCASAATAEEYWPDMEGLDYRDTVIDWELPPGTFFDLAIVHLLTTATIDRLRAEPSPGPFRDPGGSGRTSSWPPARTTRASWKTTGSATRCAIGDQVRLRRSPAPARAASMTTLPQGDLPKDSGILRTAAQHNQVNVGVYADVIAGGTIRRGDPVTLI